MTSEALVIDALTMILQPRINHNNKNCTKETCPVSDSVYGYYPSRAVNSILAILFAISLLLHIYQGVKCRSWSFMTALAIGTALEVIGYVGRLLLHNDPFSKAYIGIQLICLTVAPAFLSAGIYLTLKHITIVYGRRFSRLAPKKYTWIFISCDIVSILIQTAGTTMAASNSSSSSNLGNNIILTGLVTQVITLIIFGLLAIDVYFRITKNTFSLSTAAKEVHQTRRFRNVVLAIAVAYLCILIRCVYRVPEMAGGWGNKVMQNQTLFVLLDGVMCVIAVGLLNAFHPGMLFGISGLVAKEGREGEDVQMV